MFKWNKFTYLIPTGDSIDFSKRESFGVLNLDDADPAETLALLTMFNPYEAELYVIPNFHDNEPGIQDLESHRVYYFANGDNLGTTLVVDASISVEEAHWVVACTSALLHQDRSISRRNLLDMRYSELSFITEYVDEPSDISEFLTTIPRVKYNSLINTKPYDQKEPILQIVINEDITDVYDLIFEISRYVSYLHRDEFDHNKDLIAKILNLSNEYLPNVVDDKREQIIHRLQLYYTLTRIYVPRASYDNLLSYAKHTRSLALELKMDNAVWVVDVLTKWYFDVGDIPDIYNWDVTLVPNNLLLIPHLINLQEVFPEHSQDALDAYLHINASNDKQFVLDAMEDLTYKIGNLYMSMYNWTSAELFLNQSIVLYSYLKKDLIVSQIQRQIIHCISKHFEELAISANYFNNFGRLNEAITLAWSGMLVGLHLVETITKFDLKYEEPMIMVMDNYVLCQNALLKEESEMREVVELKLEELHSFYHSIANGELDKETIAMYTEMHSESLKFMVPQIPPKFMFLTSDGRLIYTREAILDSDDDDVSASYLLAGALTAIRSVLQEASLSQTGSVKEIALGDSIMLIEARPAVVVVSSANTVNDTLRTLTTEMADYIEENWHDELYDWFGDRESVQEMIDYADKQIINTLIND